MEPIIEDELIIDETPVSENNNDSINQMLEQIDFEHLNNTPRQTPQTQYNPTNKVKPKHERLITSILLILMIIGFLVVTLWGVIYEIGTGV